MSGATGFIGIQLVKRLLQQGNQIHALYRSEPKADLIRKKGVCMFQGDILDRDSLKKAMSGCDRAYHIAAFAGIWTRDPAMIFRLNVEDVVSGHILAMVKGRPGERYILRGYHLTYRELFALVRRAAAVNYRLYPVPLWLMMSISTAMKGWAGISGRPPLILPGLVKKFNHHWKVSSGKARMELGYDPIPAADGSTQTVRWIESQANIAHHQ